MEPSRVQYLATLSAAMHDELDPELRALAESEAFWQGLADADELSPEQRRMLDALGVPLDDEG